MVIWGIVAAVAGVFCCLLAAFGMPMSLETEVPSALGYGLTDRRDIVNISLLHQRELVFMLGIGLSIVGAVLVVGGQLLSVLRPDAAIETAEAAERQPRASGPAPASDENNGPIIVFTIIVMLAIAATGIAVSQSQRSAGDAILNAGAIADNLEAMADNLDAMADEATAAARALPPAPAPVEDEWAGTGHEPGGSADDSLEDRAGDATSADALRQVEDDIDAATINALTEAER